MSSESLTALTAYIDGASRGNPGDAAYGVRVVEAGGEEVARFGDYLGQQTNNVAEYRALVAALRWARERGVGCLEVVSDSELLVRQMNGRYRVKSAGLRPLFEEARALAGELGSFRIRHVRRDRNVEADSIANQVLDDRSGASS